MGEPSNSRNCFGVSPPMRVPIPAAGKMAVILVIEILGNWEAEATRLLLRPLPQEFEFTSIGAVVGNRRNAVTGRIEVFVGGSAAHYSEEVSGKPEREPRPPTAACFTLGAASLCSSKRPKIILPAGVWWTEVTRMSTVLLIRRRAPSA